MKSAPRSRKLAAVSAFLVASLMAQFAYAQANDDSFTVASGSVDNVLDVVTNDDVVSASILSVTAPNRGGQVRIASNRQTLIYTPASSFEGEETFSYVIIFGGFRFAAADVRVLVTGSNEAPVAQDDSYLVEEDDRLDVDADEGVLANDSDPDNDRLTALLVDGPSNGDLRLESDGSFRYDPDRRFTGEDSFSYRASDGRSVSGLARVQIRVEPRNEPPEIDSIPDQLATVGVSFELDLRQYVSDPDGPDPLEFEAVSMPPGLALSAQGIVSGVPTSEAEGTRTARFRVSDGLNDVEDTFRFVIRDDRVTDLRVTLSAGPNPVAVADSAMWSITVFNESNHRIDAPSLTGQFTGEVPFDFDPVSDPGCSLTPDGADTILSCQLPPMSAGESRTLDLTGAAEQSGDMLGTVDVTSAGAADVDPADNSAHASLSVAGSVSSVPAQSLGNVAARAVASGDIDGDGEDDLVVATAGSESVLVFLNVVDPSDERKRTLAGAPLRIGSAAGDNDIAVGDLDGDQDLDVVAAGSASSSPRIYLNDGSGAFATVALGQPNPQARSVAIGDVDGDGFTDLVFSGETGTRVYRGTGVPGQYAAGLDVGGSTGIDLVVADLIGDSRAEIVLAGAGASAPVYRYAGSSFELGANLATGPTTSVVAEDFNGDGARDLVFGRTGIGGSEWPSNPVYLNGAMSGGGFSLAENLGAAPTFAVLGADADGSGRADAIVLNETGAHQIFLSSGAGGGLLVRASDQVSVAGATGAAFGNFSVDDRLDLAIGTPAGVRIFRSDGTGRFGVGDVTPPTIQIVGASTVQTFVGAPYDDQGATATDSADGDLTDRIEITNNVNANLIGQYTVTYRAWDDSGNASALLTRNVEVRPNQPQGGGGGGALDWLSLLALLAFGAMGRGGMRAPVQSSPGRAILRRFSHS